MTQPSPSNSGDTYASAGVDTAQATSGLKGLLRWLNQTFDFPSPSGKPVLENGFYANVHDLGNDIGIAVGTDGVGTKLMVAEALDRYDTVGIDCVAMNANDVLCVGARPFALVDYLAVQEVRPEMLEQLAKGLYEGARQAGVAIASGELAQLPEMLRGQRPGSGFDIAATCLGLVRVSQVIDGRAIQDGDVVIGYLSSGIHSNGLTLARKALVRAEQYSLTSYIPELGCTLGDELLRPTLIYVHPVLAAIEATGGVTGLAHITGDGFLNLLRLRTDCGFELTDLPSVPLIFRLVQRAANIPEAELYQVFNMGVGFCAVVRPEVADQTLALAQQHGYRAQVIGRMRRDLQGKVLLPGVGLVGTKAGFRPV